jgi:hypothetical protein
LFRGQFTPAGLRQTFAAYVDNHVDLSGVETATPTFASPPTINERGWLVVRGVSDLERLRLDFMLTYQPEDGQWRCAAIAPKGEFKPPAVPEPQALTQLVMTTLQRFHAAVQQQDFTGFLAAASAPMRQQFTPESLAQAFEPVMGGALDLAPLAGEAPPELEAPVLNEERNLVVLARYPEARVRCDLLYSGLYGTWDLLGISVSREPDPAPPIPDREAVTGLVEAALLAWNGAVQAQDFGPFHATLSSAWQEQITPIELAKTFQVHVDAGTDLGAIAGTTPVLDAPPAITDEGVLEIRGRYPDAGVAFELSYAHEAEGWKLLGIGVTAQ